MPNHDLASTSTFQAPKVEFGTSAQFFILTNTNYHLGAMRMEINLEAYGLWEVIDGKSQE